MRPRLLIAVSASVLAALAFASPAAGDDRPNGTGGAYIDGGGDPTAIATQGPGGSAPDHGGGGAGDPSCHWNVVIEDDFAFHIYDADTFRSMHSATGRWLEYRCEGSGPVAFNGHYVIPEGGMVDPRGLAQDALASVQIPPPAIRTSPSESGRLYVHVPTWLSVDGDWWRSYTATAEAGRVWSTVTAQPVSVSWTLGDGSSVVCSGPGKAWTPAADESGSDCTHTYRRSSAGSDGGTFEMSATVRLEVTWTSNAPGGGTLPAITRISTIDVEVGEIQAIGTRGGS